MGRGSSGANKQSRNRAQEQSDPVLRKLNVNISASNQRLYATRAADIKPGDTIEDVFFSPDGKQKNRAEWTFRPDGGAPFKSRTFSDVQIVDVKVSANTVKVTGKFDRDVTMKDPKPSDYGKNVVTITRTFKKSEILRKRIKN